MSTKQTSGYRMPSNMSQQPVKVKTKLQHTDPVMSSSLQNIPNGLSIHSNISTGSHKNSHNQIYETKKSAMNHSTPSLSMRDIHLSPHDLSSITRASGGSNGGGLGGGNINLEPTYISKTTTSSKYTTNSYMGRGNDRSPNFGAFRNISGDGMYGAQRIYNSNNYSDANLTQQSDSLPNDRMNSTSSSNESVYSSSSRDLIASTHNNRHHTNHPPQSLILSSQSNITPPSTVYDYKASYSIRDSNASQNVLPKKIQRGKPVDKLMFIKSGQSNRDKM